MRAVMIIGSARRNGNTESLCAAAAESLEDGGFEVSSFRPFGMGISHCTNCGGCDDTGICIIDDDMKGIYDAVSKSDVVILGTPVHFSGTSSILKQVIDRFQCLWVRPEAGGRRILGLIADGGSEEALFRNIVSVARSVANTIGAEWGGEVCVNGTDSGLSEGDISEAYNLGTRLAGMFRQG